jgi:hypothetical protein
MTAFVIPDKCVDIVAPLCNDFVESFLFRDVITRQIENEILLTIVLCGIGITSSSR